MTQRMVKVLGELVRINSVNQTLSGGPGENEIAEHVMQFLHNVDIDAEIQIVSPQNANVVGLIPGGDHSRSVLLNAHLDTVGVDGMHTPFNLRCDGDTLYGRGTYDMKGSIAIMLLLAEYFSAHPPPVNVWLTFVADEEDKSLGMDYLVQNWLPGISPLPLGAVFLEPTELNIGVAHKGFTWYEVNIAGKAAHGSRPSEGIDAIFPLAPALTELSAIQEELNQYPPDPLLGNPSLHASIVEGGTEFSVIPAFARLQWERRTLPEESQAALDDELKRVIGKIETFPGSHNVRGSEVFVRPPYRVDLDALILEMLRAAAPQSKEIGLSFWADSALGGLAGIPSILFGPAGHGAHAIDEWVSLKSLNAVYGILKKMIQSFSE